MQFNGFSHRIKAVTWVEFEGNWRQKNEPAKTSSKVTKAKTKNEFVHFWLDSKVWLDHFFVREKLFLWIAMTHRIILYEMDSEWFAHRIFEFFRFRDRIFQILRSNFSIYCDQILQFSQGDDTKSWNGTWTLIHSTLKTGNFLKIVFQ